MHSHPYLVDFASPGNVRDPGVTDDIALRFVQLSGEPARNFGTEVVGKWYERTKEVSRGCAELATHGEGA